jgi:hypothetical protein
MAEARGIDWEQQPLGEMSDSALARRLGVDPTVSWTRASSMRDSHSGSLAV